MIWSYEEQELDKQEKKQTTGNKIEIRDKINNLSGISLAIDPLVTIGVCLFIKMSSCRTICPGAAIPSSSNAYKQ